MKTLFIDTHLFDINIYLVKDDKILRDKHISGEKNNSKYLVSTIKEVCEGESYDQIVVVNGPGSFTGVRLGVTVAKTLAYTKKIPIKVVSSLECMCFSKDSCNHIYAISDGNGYFIGEFNNYHLIKEYYYVTNSEFKELIQIKKIETEVELNICFILDKLKLRKGINPHKVNPIYIKLIGVENDKKNK